MRYWISTWPINEVPDLIEGGWVAVVCEETDVDAVGLRLRAAGVEPRDCISVLAQIPLLVVIGRSPATAGFAELAIRDGAGSLDIDPCRIATDELESGTYTRGEDNSTKVALNCAHDGSFLGGFEYDGSKGRWPGNTVLVHAAECDRRGTRRVKGTTGTAGGRMAGNDTSTYNDAWSGSVHAGADCSYVGDDGKEEVPDWRCSRGCSAPELDGQSGVTRSPESYVRSSKSENIAVWGEGMGEPEGAVSKNYGDEGGASRFFHQFGAADELMVFLDTLLSMGGDGG